MKQHQFEIENAKLWQEIEAILGNHVGQRASQLPQLYRRLCQSLALALQRGYSPALCDHLQKLVHDCHEVMYGTMVARPLTLYRWIMIEFPQRVREERVLLWISMLAFWGVALAIGLLVWFKPHWAYSFMSPDDLEQARAMYMGDSINKGRGGSEGDIYMWGLYIWNNVSIGFRTFAGGLLGGVPAIVSLAFNGMHFGVVGAWLSQDPETRNHFWSFVITHASFEITGLILCGQAGMRLGLALLRPGRLSRRHALMDASERMFPVIIGAASMIAFAAFFEGFWSASTSIPYQIKYLVGGMCWLIVIMFFVFAGRGEVAASGNQHYKQK